MDFPIAAIDDVLATTRAVRRRLDLDRVVPAETILECIDLAEQAPTGGNQASRRWIVVTDEELKARLGELYRSSAAGRMSEQADRLRGTGHPMERTVESAAYLAENLQRVPVIVIVTIHGRHDGSGRPGLFDSVIQAAWSFCLALRARGLGTAWTTAWLAEQDAVADLLGIPDGVTQIVLLPVAYTLGTDFRPAPRLAASDITWFDGWGLTTERSTTGPVTMADGPGVTVEIDIDAPPGSVWPSVVDLDLPARFSSEFDGADWLDEPGLGARFVGRNSLPGREWETTSHVVAWEPGARFGWHVRDPDQPGARWSFTLEPIAGATRLRFSVVLGPGPSGLAEIIDSQPDDETAIIRSRRLHHRENMTRTVAGIKAEVEGP